MTKHYDIPRRGGGPKPKQPLVKPDQSKQKVPPPPPPPKPQRTPTGNRRGG